jgi:hypothetical protein
MALSTSILKLYRLITNTSSGKAIGTLIAIVTTACRHTLLVMHSREYNVLHVPFKVFFQAWTDRNMDWSDIVLTNKATYRCVPSLYSD